MSSVDEVLGEIAAALAKWPAEQRFGTKATLRSAVCTLEAPR